MIVLDASAAVELVLGTPNGQQVLHLLRSPGASIHAPHLLDLEVASALRKQESAGALTAIEAKSALDLFRALDVERSDHELLLPRIWQLRHVITPYDGAYVALAEVLRCKLVTCDGRLARSHGHSASIELVVT